MFRTKVNSDEHILSMNIPRYGGSRRKRYLNYIQEEATMIKTLRDIIEHFTQGKECSKQTNKFVLDSIEKATKLSYSEGLLAKYKDDYVMVFLKVKGLDNCALRLTYNEEERNLIHNFYMVGSNTARIAFSVACLNIVREKQRVNLINGEPTYGMIYSSYPDKDKPIESFVRYINAITAGKIANSNSIYVVNSALDRGVSENEILAVLPTGVENKFLNVGWTDFERAQIEALQPDIAKMA